MHVSAMGVSSRLAIQEQWSASDRVSESSFSPTEALQKREVDRARRIEPLGEGR